MVGYRVILTVGHPAPVGRRGEGHPDRNPQRPGQVRDGRVGSDEQVEVLEHRRRVQEGPGRFVQPPAQVRDRELAAQRVKLIETGVLLDAEKPHSRNLRQDFVIRQWDRSMLVAAVFRIPLPVDPDLESGDAGKLLLPALDQIGVGQDVRHLGRNGLDGGRGQPRDIHQRAIHFVIG